MPTLKQQSDKLNIPSHLEIACNGIEAMRLRHELVQALIQRKTLGDVYQKQMQMMSKDEKIMFKDSFNFDCPWKSNSKWTNFVDDGCGQK